MTLRLYITRTSLRLNARHLEGLASESRLRWMPERTVSHGGILLLMLVMVMQIGLLLLPSQLHTVKSTKSCDVITHLCRSRWFLADLAEPLGWFRNCLGSSESPVSTLQQTSLPSKWSVVMMPCAKLSQDTRQKVCDFQSARHNYVYDQSMHLGWEKDRSQKLVFVHVQQKNVYRYHTAIKPQRSQTT